MFIHVSHQCRVHPCQSLVPQSCLAVLMTIHGVLSHMQVEFALFLQAGDSDATKNKDADADSMQISDDEDDKHFVNKLHDSDSESSPDERRSTRQFRRPLLTVGAGRRAAVAAAAAKSDAGGFGAWERHTRGIGMKLLEQMGYQPGKGLGSEGQGITTPVQATQRVGKAAVGYFGPETAPAPLRGNEAAEVISETASGQLDGPRYKKKTAPRPKGNIVYKTTDEIVASISPADPASAIKHRGLFLNSSEMSRVKVIDMTCKEQRVYTGYEAALSKAARYTRQPNEDVEVGPDADKEKLVKRREGRLFDCPALRRNLEMILRSNEDAIRKLDRTSRFEEDHCVALEHEIEKLSEFVKTESVEARRLQVALDLIAQFEEHMKRMEGGLSPDVIASWMNRVKEACAELPEMPVLMAAMARPMLDTSLNGWKPLSEPNFCFQLLSKWRDFFQDTSAFDVVLETNWLTTLRRTIVNDWDPRDCEPLLDVLEIWRPLIPDQMLLRILHELVLPKLHDAVSKWNPLTDTIPIHTWLHPWLPWFGGAEHLAGVHDAVLQKLGTCLTNWHPSDGSAHSILTPWRSVVSIGAMSAFLNRHVVPKLSLTLQQFKLNPASQNMDGWTWVMRWADLVGPAVIVNLLEQHFLPRWLTVLSNWLNQGVEAKRRGDHASAGQVYQEVGRWYAGWKGQLPPECMEYAGIKDSLTKALAMMERAMRGLPPQEPKPNVATDASHYTAPVRAAPLTSNFTSAPLVAPPPTTLRKQVEQIAAQRGFAFHPIPNRLFEGQQVYRLERLHVFFDRNVSFVYNPTDGGWHPVSLSELMSKADC
ncbi:unnamed protein product [Dicrocoelium dendriticum]|nr:unnamed protein product [Dicrocoelium dendriticum]